MLINMSKYMFKPMRHNETLIDPNPQSALGHIYHLSLKVTYILEISSIKLVLDLHLARGTINK